MILEQLLPSTQKETTSKSHFAFGAKTWTPIPHVKMLRWPIPRIWSRYSGDRPKSPPPRSHAHSGRSPWCGTHLHLGPIPNAPRGTKKLKELIKLPFLQGIRWHQLIFWENSRKFPFPWGRSSLPGGNLPALARHRPATAWLQRPHRWSRGRRSCRSRSPWEMWCWTGLNQSIKAAFLVETNLMFLSWKDQGWQSSFNQILSNLY